MSNCGQYDFDTPWPCMLLEWGKGKKPRNDERKRSELCNVGYTRTNWFSQPGFLGVESSSWTMSPAMAEGASRTSKITAENKRIEEIFSEAMDAVRFTKPLPAHSSQLKPRETDAAASWNNQLLILIHSLK